MERAATAAEDKELRLNKMYELFNFFPYKRRLLFMGVDHFEPAIIPNPIISNTIISDPIISNPIISNPIISDPIISNLF